MTDFEKAMKEYEARLGRSYPFDIGLGFPCDTDEENIDLIKKCIAENRPVDFMRDSKKRYIPGRVY